MVWVDIQDPFVASLRLGEVIAIFVNDTQIDQSSNVGRKTGCRPFVESKGFLVISLSIVLKG
jgi:hypothetical protein